MRPALVAQRWRFLQYLSHIAVLVILLPRTRDRKSGR